MMPTFERTPYPAEWFHCKDGRPAYYTEEEVAEAVKRNTRTVPDNVTDLEHERVKRTTGGAQAWSIKIDPENAS